MFSLDAKQLEANVGNLHEWSLMSLVQNKLTIFKQSCASEIKRPFANFTSGSNFFNLSMTPNLFALLGHF